MMVFAPWLPPESRQPAGLPARELLRQHAAFPCAEQIILIDLLLPGFATQGLARPLPGASKSFWDNKKLNMIYLLTGEETGG